MSDVLEQLKNVDGFASIHELAIEELDDIAGGRAIRNSENDDCSVVTQKFAKRIEHLSDSEARPYIETFWSGYKKWRNAIANASDDSADIYLSDFVDF